MVSTENPFAEERSTDQNKAQKRKRIGKTQTIMKRLRAEMADISEQQKLIREGQMEVRERFQEIECTLLISKQAARYQRSLNEMFKIVIAGENSNLSEADGMIQCLREEGKHDVLMQGMKQGIKPPAVHFSSGVLKTA